MTKEQVRGLGLFAGMMMLLIAVLSMTKDNNFLSGNSPVRKTGEQHPFECDYRIDLRMDYILVGKNDGDIDTVRYGELEEYFEKDNL